MDSLTDTRQPLASSPCGGRSPRTVSAARRIFFHGGKRRRIPPGFRHFGRETLCASTPHPRSGDDTIINRLARAFCGNIKPGLLPLLLSFFRFFQKRSRVFTLLPRTAPGAPLQTLSAPSHEAAAHGHMNRTSDRRSVRSVRTGHTAA